MEISLVSNFYVKVLGAILFSEQQVPTLDDEKRSKMFLVYT